MTSAYILIAAVILLGGMIAALGDRLGSRVGKARWRLFDLRPKQTAVLVTVATGTVISASTLGLIFALSKSLRQGVFQLDEILLERQNELKQVMAQKDQVNQELTETRRQQDLAQQRYTIAQRQLGQIAQQSAKLRSELTNLNRDRQRLEQQRQQLQGEIQERDRQLQDRTRSLGELRQQRESLQRGIETRDRNISSLDRAIASKNNDISQKEQQLTALQQQAQTLREAVGDLEVSYVNLRLGNVAIVRNQVLSMGVLTVQNPAQVGQALDALLQQANDAAIKALGSRPPQERVVQIPNAAVQGLFQSLRPGQDYVLRVLSTGNYIPGDMEVLVRADAVPNRLLFNRNEVMAASPFNGDRLTTWQVSQTLSQLNLAAEIRARRFGMLGELQVENGEPLVWLNFVNRLLQDASQVDQVMAIAIEPTYTAGPLKLRFVALQGDRVLFATEGERENLLPDRPTSP